MKKIPTTVKIEEEQYNDFKVLSIRHRCTLQSFVEKCIYLYVHTDAFRQTINNFSLPILSISGSL